MAATARQEHDLKEKYQRMARNTALPPLDRLRAHVMSKGVRSLKSLATTFKRFDQNGDHKLDWHEFRDAFSRSGVLVDEATERECFDTMDLDGAGVIDFDEFIIALRPPLSNRRVNLINEAFNKLDKDDSEDVTADDLKGVYNASKHPKYLSGEWTEEQVFSEWLNSFNGPHNTSGVVTREDFLNYYVGVSASIDSDCYFDLMMRKAWKL